MPFRFERVMLFLVLALLPPLAYGGTLTGKIISILYYPGAPNIVY
ncbi:MAG: hypothetical protein JWL63_2759 [Rhodocyclales bacterium]|nr:hypothetical protein [Rhodocyclales bacterium]